MSIIQVNSVPTDKSNTLMANVMSTSSMINIFCESAPKTDFEVDILHASTSTGTINFKIRRGVNSIAINMNTNLTVYYFAYVNRLQMKSNFVN